VKKKTRLNNYAESVMLHPTIKPREKVRSRRFYMKCNVYSAMTLGARSVQEDCIMDGVDQWQTDEFINSREIVAETLLLAVCDGMGGHDKGDEASRFVCEQLKNISHDPIMDAGKLKEILAGIQETALEKLPENCGTTLAGLFVSDNRIIAFNAGDSRVYKFTPEGLMYISHDHSLVQEMVDKSLIPDVAAKDHPLKNLIEFGFGPIFGDAWERYTVHIYESPLEDGDIYLLCSDGLMDAMRDAVIHDCLMQSAEEMGPRLLDLMKRKRLNDNTSFIIVKIHH
jgi:serine/threonine protein phosphatase PrpC